MRIRFERATYTYADPKAPRTYRLTVEGAGGDSKQPVRQLHFAVELTETGARRLRQDILRVVPR